MEEQCIELREKQTKIDLVCYLLTSPSACTDHSITPAWLAPFFSKHSEGDRCKRLSLVQPTLFVKY